MTSSCSQTILGQNHQSGFPSQRASNVETFSCHDVMQPPRQQTLLAPRWPNVDPVGSTLGQRRFPSQRASNVETFPCHDVMQPPWEQTLLAPRWPNVDPVGSTLGQRRPNVPCYLDRLLLKLHIYVPLCSKSTFLMVPLHRGSITEEGLSQNFLMSYILSFVVSALRYLQSLVPFAYPPTLLSANLPGHEESKPLDLSASTNPKARDNSDSAYTKPPCPLKVPQIFTNKKWVSYILHLFIPSAYFIYYYVCLFIYFL